MELNLNSSSSNSKEEKENVIENNMPYLEQYKFETQKKRKK